MRVDGVKKVVLDSMYVGGSVITIRLRTLASQKYMRSFTQTGILNATLKKIQHGHAPENGISRA
jgi:hypothetical protein